jgi:predicted negative regulator of RcsB-dependent stress response
VATHLTRKDLKHDVVAETVEHQIDWFAAHKQNVTRYAVILVALVVVIGGGWSYRNYQIANRQHALAEAMDVQNAPVGQPSPNGGQSFATEELRAAAAEKAFNKVLTSYPGDDEGFLAEFYLAGIDADNGKMDLARRKYQDVADHASANYASLAKLALAQLDFAQGKINEARAVLKDLHDHPTDLVSKEQADITLARGIGATNPEEARKLLVPIASKAGSNVAEIATTALAELTKK